MTDQQPAVISMLRNVPVDPPVALIPKVVFEDFRAFIEEVTVTGDVNSILLTGVRGTGKTSAAHHMARILERRLLIVDTMPFRLYDAFRAEEFFKLLAEDLKTLGEAGAGDVMILIDDFDLLLTASRLAKARRDHQELVTRGIVGNDESAPIDDVLEALPRDAVLVACSMREAPDGPLAARFDRTVDFNRYSKGDLVDIAVAKVEELLAPELSDESRRQDISDLEGFLGTLEKLPLPGELIRRIDEAFTESAPDETHFLERLRAALS